MSHNNPSVTGDLAVAAGFRVTARRDLPLLRYIQVVQPDGEDG